VNPFVRFCMAVNSSDEIEACGLICAFEEGYGARVGLICSLREKVT
jgi:hypothetical protein